MHGTLNILKAIRPPADEYCNRVTIIRISGTGTVSLDATSFKQIKIVHKRHLHTYIYLMKVFTDTCYKCCAHV